MDGTPVEKGQIIALLDGKLVTTGDSVSTVIDRSLLEAEPPEDGVVTLYWGGDTQESQALETMERLKETLPNIEVETVYGGQPFYHYVASIE
jgi:dihydroxyacetone kinase-like predicted kinase